MINQNQECLYILCPKQGKTISIFCSALSITRIPRIGCVAWQNRNQTRHISTKVGLSCVRPFLRQSKDCCNCIFSLAVALSNSKLCRNLFHVMYRIQTNGSYDHDPNVKVKDQKMNLLFVNESTPKQWTYLL